jgi:D-serine deaminase-like pyridoxal phosphate-dependent protein
MPSVNASLHTHLATVSLDPRETKDLMTPALAIYPEIVDSNILATLKILQGNANRWQPHVKTAKLEHTMRQLCAHGVTRFKCATTLELMTACRAGATEVLMSYPSVGPRARRVQEIAVAYPQVRVCSTIENNSQIGEWARNPLPLYVDVNPGMNRTGIEEERVQEIVNLATAIGSSGLEFAGLHYYDGHNRQLDFQERKKAAFRGYEQLLLIIKALRSLRIPVGTVITSGTPAFPCATSFPEFSNGAISHRVSPGTLVYNDLATLAQLPDSWGYRPAALVITSVISHPTDGVFTCDAGHKAVSCDAGIPNCTVLGHPEFEPQHPSEEHLPMRVPEGVVRPQIGETLYLTPRHVCTTVNNFDEALLVRKGMITEVVKVSARGRESPLALRVSPGARGSVSVPH